MTNAVQIGRSRAHSLNQQMTFEAGEENSTSLHKPTAGISKHSNRSNSKSDEKQSARVVSFPGSLQRPEELLQLAHRSAEPGVIERPLSSGRKHSAYP